MFPMNTSADAAARQAGEASPTPSRTNQQIAGLISQWRNLPPGNPYRNLVDGYFNGAWSVADYFVASARSGQSPEPGMVSYLLQSKNVPQNVWAKLFGGGGGGVSAEDRANRVRSYSVSIFNRASTLGLSITPEAVDYIAKVAEAQNYSSEQVDAALAGIIDWTNLQSGSITSYMDDVKATASSYLVPIADDTIKEWSRKLAFNQASVQGLESFIKAQAKLANPWMAEYIDQGIAPSDLLLNARNAIAQSLEIDANTVDFTDERYMNMATVTDKSGTTRLATSKELIGNIRKDSAWADTSEASRVAASTGQLLSRIFGRSVF